MSFSVAVSVAEPWILSSGTPADERSAAPSTRDVLTGFGERLFDQRVEIGGDDGAQGASPCQRRQRAVVGIRLVAVEHLQHWQVVVAGEVADEKLGEGQHA